MQEKGGVGLNDDAVTGRSGWELLRDQLCSTISDGSLTTGGRTKVVAMPG